MELSILFDNITNPALLFFVLGVVAVQLKSDLQIPENSSKFISAYLLLSIGFKGGQELAHSTLNLEILLSMSLGLFMAVFVPFYSFYFLKRKLSLDNAVAISASYGSVSTVTFVTAISFLDFEQVGFAGYMIAVMALMEAPAIIVGAWLKKKYDLGNKEGQSMGSAFKQAVTNGSVILILGSLLIGALASEEQAQGIKPFTTDIFKGFLAVFLLDKGLNSGKQINVLLKKGIFPLAFAALFPFINGLLALFISRIFLDDPGNQLLFAILGASASYIAVPAAMKSIAPSANMSLYLPMALGITFPINVIIGIPFYFTLITLLG